MHTATELAAGVDDNSSWKTQEKPYVELAFTHPHSGADLGVGLGGRGPPPPFCLGISFLLQTTSVGWYFVLCYFRYIFCGP